MNQPNNRQAGGFTLIELIVTIAIAGILFAMMAPNYQNFVANQRVKTSANTLLMSMLFARSEAIKRNATVSVVAHGDGWASGWTVTTLVDVTVTTLRQQDALTGVVLTSTGGINTISYARNGRLATASPTLTVTDDKGKAAPRILSIDLSGQPRVEIDKGSSS